MTKNNFNKDVVLSARVHPSLKKKLSGTGYNARHAIEYFVNNYYNANPSKRIQVKRVILEEEIAHLKKKECEIQLELEHKEALLKKLHLNEDVDVVEEEVDEFDYPSEVTEGINIVQAVLDRKKDMIVSSVKSKEDNIDCFIDSYDEFMLSTFNQYNGGLSWKEFKDVLVEELVL